MIHPTWMGKTEWFRRHGYRAEMVRMEDWELLFRTCATSQFANLPDVLLGYREDSLSLRKILVGRERKCRVMMQEALKGRARGQAVAGVLGQIGRSMVDLLAIGTHLDYRVLKHRARPASIEEVEDWVEVFRQTHLRVSRRREESEMFAV